MGEAHKEGRHHRKVRYPLRCLAPSANSAERTLSSVRPSVSGTADPAARPPLEEPTPSLLPLPPPQGQRSVVSVRLLRFKGTLGTGVEFFERFLCIGSHDPIKGLIAAFGCRSHNDHGFIRNSHKAMAPS